MYIVKWCLTENTQISYTTRYKNFIAFWSKKYHLLTRFFAAKDFFCLEYFLLLYLLEAKTSCEHMTKSFKFQKF